MAGRWLNARDATQISEGRGVQWSSVTLTTLVLAHTSPFSHGPHMHRWLPRDTKRLPPHPLHRPHHPPPTHHSTMSRHIALPTSDSRHLTGSGNGKADVSGVVVLAITPRLAVIRPNAVSVGRMAIRETNAKQTH